VTTVLHIPKPLAPIDGSSTSGTLQAVSAINSRSLHRVCRPDLANANVAESNFRVGLDLDNVAGKSLLLGAGSSASSLSIEPLHGIALAPPDTHGENHTTGHGITHLLCTAETDVVICVRGLAVLVLDDVASNLGRSGDGDNGALDHLAVLDVVAVHLLELTVLIGGELGNDCELAGRVDLEVLATAVKLRNTVAVVVPAAASLVADTLLLALATCAAVQAWDAAGVGSNVGGARVRLPDIHLVTADTLALDVTHSVNERCDIALSITVSTTLVSTNLAVSACALSTIGRHLRKIQSTVHTTRKLLGLDIEGELSAGKLKHLILLLVRLEEVNTRRNRLAVAEHLKAKGVTRGADTLGLVSSFVHTGEHAVLGTCCLVGAGLGVGGFTPAAAVLAVSLADAVKLCVGDDVVCRLLAALCFCAAVRVDLRVLLLGIVRSLSHDRLGEQS
jgi:hypothetical protein